MSDIKYIVKPEEGIVIGILDKANCTGARVEACRKMPGSLWWEDHDIYDDGDYYKAIARVRDGDVFDEKVGKSIVAKKIKWKYHRNMMKKYQQNISHYKNIVKTLEELEAHHHAEMWKCDEELKKYE